jgi:4,5-DOPA dioxygenase extradiol
MTNAKRPAVFLSHGSPMLLLDDDEYTHALRELGASIPAPAAAVVVSAHWEVPAPVHVTSSPSPPPIYDFGGFPPELYRVVYAPPGAPDLAGEIVALLEQGGSRATADASRGLDHGAWIPLHFVYPAATVPVVQVSLWSGAEPADLLRMGRALAPLRDHEVLLLGSGGIVHNLRRVVFEKDAPVDPWAKEFDAWIRARLEKRDIEALTSYRTAAPHADLAVPTPEHLAPLFVVLGSTGANERVADLYAGFRYGNLSMRSLVFR